MHCQLEVLVVSMLQVAIVQEEPRIVRRLLGHLILSKLLEVLFELDEMLINN
jgi:hypothetical protein